MPIVDLIQKLIADKEDVDSLGDSCCRLYYQAEHQSLEIEKNIGLKGIVSSIPIYPYLVQLFCQELQGVNFLNEASWIKTRDKIKQWRLGGHEDSQSHVIKEALLLVLHDVYIKQQRAHNITNLDLLAVYHTTDWINYSHAWVTLQETLMSLNADHELKLAGQQFFAQLALSNDESQTTIVALTSVLAVVTHALKTQSMQNVIDCMRYYQTRLALEDTLAKQPKNQAIRVFGKSILDQIVRLKSSPHFPLAKLGTVLSIIDTTIKDQSSHVHHDVVSLIQYYQAWLALQETLSKSRINQRHKLIGNAILEQVDKVKVSSNLPLDDLMESLETVNAIINVQVKVSDDVADCLYYEQARLRLQTTLVNPKNDPLLLSLGEKVLAKTEQLKKDPKRMLSLYELTQVLELSHQAIEKPSMIYVKAGLKQCSKIAPRTHQTLHDALLGLLGVVILIVSVATALVSFGVASPLSFLGITMGLSLIAQVVSIGTGVVGVGMIGRSLFTLFRPKCLPEQLEEDMAHLFHTVKRQCR